MLIKDKQSKRNELESFNHNTQAQNHGGHMNEHYSESPAHQFLQSLKALSQEKTLVKCEIIQQSIQNQSESIPAEDFVIIVDFSAEQLARWDTKWLFSSASEPDSEAASEKSSWASAWKTAYDALIVEVPALSDNLFRTKNLTCIKHVMERRLEINKNKPITRFKCNVFSRLANNLNSIGLKSIAHYFYKRALFPPDTVGFNN
jgi:hypothetical protein